MHTGFSDNPTYEDARTIAAPLIAALRGRRARPGAARVHALHLRRPAGGRRAAAAAARPTRISTPRSRPTRQPWRRYEFEPDPDAILDRLLPRYAEARVYAALLNAAASEHAARQRAMKAATDNAEELILTSRAP